MKHRGSFFDTGEMRQLYARDVRLPMEAPLIYLEEGAASLLRDDARSGALICPVPGCPDPRFTTVGGSKRAHFRHLRRMDRSDHAPESLHHIHAKALVAEWLRASYPESTPEVEWGLNSRVQIADVYAEVNGYRYAFEIQYSALTVDEWVGRHRGYRSMGVVDVWMFGHIPPHLRRTSTDGIVRLQELHGVVRDSGVPLVWLNPDTRQVGTAMPERGEWTPPGTVQVGVDELQACSLDDRGVLSPTLVAERLAEGERLERQRLEDERYGRERQRAEQRERERREAERRSEEEKQRARERRERARSITRARWHKVQDSLEASLGGDFPEVVTAALASDENLWIHPVHWHALFFEKWLQGRIGQSFTYKEAAAHTFQVQDNSETRSVYFALNSYLVFLRKHRYVDFKGNTHWIDPEISVFADAASPPQPLPDRQHAVAGVEPQPAPWSPLDEDDPDRYLRRNDYLWKTSRERLERMSGGLPDVVFEDLPLDRAVNLHPHHWHAHVYWRWVASGQEFMIAEVAAQLEVAPAHDLEDVTAAVGLFIASLVELGLVVLDEEGEHALYRLSRTET